MKYITNAGHFYDSCNNKEDTGAKSGVHIESRMAITLRDALISKLQAAQREFISVPDKLDISKSIEWINKNAKEDDILVDIHFNAHKDTRARGTEAYYYREQIIAKVFAEKVSESLGIPNRGYFPDNRSLIGELSILRKTKCRAVLIEVCFLTSPEDIRALNYDKAAQGILNAFTELDPPITTTEDAPKTVRVLTLEEKEKANVLLTWIELLKVKLNLIKFREKKLGSTERSLTIKASWVNIIVAITAIAGVQLTDSDINGFLVVVGAGITLVASIASWIGRVRAGGINIFGKRI